jgi:exodeoxyribonuclease-1
MRDKQTVSGLLDTRKPEPVLHTSSRIPAARGCTTLVLPLATVPDRPKETIVVDLMADPSALLGLTVDELRDRLFVPTADLPEGVERVALKTVASNKVPMLAPAAVLRGVDQERIGLDEARCRKHMAELLGYREELRVKVMELFLPTPREPGPDPDDSLYSGGFFTQRDRGTMDRLRAAKPEDLAEFATQFDDSRLPELLFRYRARNYPETLSPDEAADWEKQRLARIHDDSVDGRLGLGEFELELIQARKQLLENQTETGSADESKAAGMGEVLDQVEAWVRDLVRSRA